MGHCKKEKNDKKPIFHAVLQAASLTLRALSDLVLYSNCFADEETGAESGLWHLARDHTAYN